MANHDSAQSPANVSAHLDNRNAGKKSSQSLTTPDQQPILHPLVVIEPPADATLNRLTRLAARVLQTPIALVSLVDAQQQFHISGVGLPESWTGRQIPRSLSICGEVEASGEPLIITDVQAHPRFAHHTAVLELQGLAYVGMPLRSTAGVVIGSFCVIDTRPRQWTPDEIATLRDLAAAVQTEIELRNALQAVRDQTAKAEERATALAAAHASSQAILDSITDAFFALDSDWRFTYVNSQSERLLHQPRAKILGQEIWAVFPRIVGTEFALKYQQALADDETKMFEAFFAPQAAWYEVQVYPSAAGLAVYFRDITARKDLEAERDRLATIKDDFIHIASHELRAPLTPMMLGMRMVQRAIGKPGQEATMQHRMDEVMARTKHLSRLIDDMLSMTRISEGQLALVKEPCDLSRTLRDAVETQRAFWHREITLAIMPNTVPALADAERIWQVYTNLISNACKYSPENTPVTVTADIVQQDREAYFRVSVQNQGAGIDAEALPHLFERFYRSQATVGKEGLGLGLFIAQGIAQGHGGGITATSAGGQGSIFTVLVPVGSGSDT